MISFSSITKFGFLTFKRKSYLNGRYFCRISRLRARYKSGITQIYLYVIKQHEEARTNLDVDGEHVGVRRGGALAARGGEARVLGQLRQVLAIQVPGDARRGARLDLELDEQVARRLRHLRARHEARRQAALRQSKQKNSKDER